MSSHRWIAGASAGALVGLVLLLAAPHAAPPSGEAAPLEYRLAIPEPSRRELVVELDVAALPDRPLDIRMSRTSPGRYAVHDFAKNVFDVRATSGAGTPLVVDQVEPNRWTVAGHDGAVRFRYRVYGDRIDGTYLAVGRSHAHVNPPAALAWPVGLDRPVLVTLDLPPGSPWTVATQLFATDHPRTFRAPNLQYLMDSPIEAGPGVTRSFVADLPPGAFQSTAPTIAIHLHHTGADEAIDPIVEGLRRLVRTEAAVFGEYPPYEDGRYTFLMDFLPWAVGDGMEHRNSTVITGSATGAGLTRQALETAAHEFFHGWNVERIRPRTLEPFDFERPAAPGELWLAEGFTSYYQEVALARSGLSTMEEAMRGFEAAVNSVVSTPALAFHSAVEMSRMASLVDGAGAVDRTNWPGTYLSYYTHGQALALGFDLAIRERTANTRTLDDFMRAMWRTHGRPGGLRPGYVDAPYTLDDVEARLTEVTGDAAFAGGLLERYVKGRERMDYPRLLDTAGFVVRRRRPGVGWLGPTPLQPTGDGLRVGAQPPFGSPLYDAGIGEDDEITAIDGKAVTGSVALDKALARTRPGTVVTAQVAHRGERREATVRVTLGEDPAIEIVPIERTGRTLTDAARRVRESWLGAAERDSLTTVGQNSDRMDRIHKIARTSTSGPPAGGRSFTRATRRLAMPAGPRPECRRSSRSIRRSRAALISFQHSAPRPFV